MANTRIVSLPGFEDAIAKKGIKRKDVAEQLGITYPALWKIVSGEMKRIDPDILRQMAAILDCTTDDLLNPPQPSTSTEDQEPEVGERADEVPAA